MYMYETIEIIPRDNGLFVVMVWDSKLCVTPFVDKTKEEVISIIERTIR